MRGSEDADESFPNETYFWYARVERIISGKRGREILKEVREALLALPEHRLIANALSTFYIVERETANDNGWPSDAQYLKTEQGEGVCLVGAYAWHKLVQQGMSPQEAFAAMPNYPDYSGEAFWETADYATRFGMQRTLAEFLEGMNDWMTGATPERRWEMVMEWLNKMLEDET